MFIIHFLIFNQDCQFFYTFEVRSIGVSHCPEYKILVHLQLKENRENSSKIVFTPVFGTSSTLVQEFRRLQGPPNFKGANNPTHHINPSMIDLLKHFFFGHPYNFLKNNSKTEP